MLRVILDDQHPNPRQLQRMVDIVRNGGIIIYPTDTVYGLGCDMMNKKAVEKVRKLKGRQRKHPFSFICPDLKDIAKYAIVSNHAYRVMRRILPGPYTLILPASRQVPRIMMSNKVTVGIRIPDHAVPRQLAEHLGNPIITTSLPMRDENTFHDPDEIMQDYPQIDGIIDCGLIHPQPSTVIDFSERAPRLVRLGKGPVDDLDLDE